METCSDCNYSFPEKTDSESETRTPCPQCGSTRRTYHVSVQSTVHVRGSVSATVSPAVVINSVPPFSFGAIIRVERTLPDGEVISLVDPLYTHLITEIEKDPQLIYQIDPRKWEQIIAAAYDKAGF